jgi:TctA family transporter
MIKSEGHISAFFARPIAGTLGVVMIGLVVVPPLLRLLNRRRGAHRA